jgi:RHS repeat-associated protein
VFNGDTLVATVDQQMASGNATGTAKTRYIHPDRLGSTNVVTDENDNLVQTLDYFPYGSTRVSSATSTNERRRFIGQFSDDSTLNYLNARYYDSARGQFITEDPIFLQLGVPDQVKGLAKRTQPDFLRNPQAINPYGYANDNPMRNSDPSGLGVWEGSLSGGWWLGGGTINLDVDTTQYGAQLSLGPAIGPNFGARLSGSYDPSGSLDQAGLYLQVSAGAAVGLGKNFSSESPIIWQGGGPKITPLPPGKVTWAFGLYVGATDAVLFKEPSIYLSPTIPSSNNRSTSNSSVNYTQLANQVVSYASNPGANLTDPSFAEALRAINLQSAPWLASSVSVTTPTTIKQK